MSNLNLEFTGQPVQVESCSILKLFTKYQFSFSKNENFLQAYQLFLSPLCLNEVIQMPENLVFTTPTWLDKTTSFLKALVVTGTFNACAWRWTSCHPGGGRHFCDHVCSTKPSWQSMSFYCRLSLYHPVVTRMEIKIKNIIDLSSSPSCLFYLILISKVRSQVKFSSLPVPAVLWRVQKDLQQCHDSPSNQKLSWARKLQAAVPLPSKRQWGCCK